jgi:argininosuccinate lyase
MLLYSTVEFGFLALPDSLTTGSSIMPQKRNPDVLELVRGKTSTVRAAASQVQSIRSGLTSGYHRDYQLIKEPVITAFDTVEGCLQIMARVVEALQLDEKRMRASCTREIYAADLAAERAQAGVPFRDAYQAAMADLDALTVDDSFIESRIAAYKTIGSMGEPSLDCYDEPLAQMANWIEEQRHKASDSRSRLRGPLSA